MTSFSRSAGSSTPTVWIALHDLSRTGVPTVLLRLLRATPEDKRTDIHLVAMIDGPLRPELDPLVGSLTVLEPLGRRSMFGAVVAGVRSVGGDRRELQSLGRGVETVVWKRRTSHIPEPDVLLVHGAGAWPLTSLVSSETPVVLHLHELRAGLDRSVPVSEQRRAMGRASTVMAVGRAVADLAISRGCDPRKIQILPGVVEYDTCRKSSSPGDLSPSDLRLEPGHDWAVGIGRPGWRKGTDRLYALAHRLCRSCPSAAVGWVGGRPSGQDAIWVESTDPVRWVDEVTDPWVVAAGASVVVVPSREDPLPLVALEAGQRSLPVVAMSTGDLPELLADDRGMAVDGQSLGGFCGSVETLLGNPGRSAELGERLAEYVAANHDSRLIAPLWWEILEDAASR